MNGRQFHQQTSEHALELAISPDLGNEEQIELTAN